MVVLSRGRGAAPKAVPKLSVPPPLNLPSLRKEHEKFDILGPGGGAGGAAGAGSGPRPTSSGVGWTKPVAAATALPDKSESSAVEARGGDSVGATDGLRGGVGGSYMPPSVRSNGFGVVVSASATRNVPSAEKSVVLRGEDFPTLQAARPVSSGESQKQKDSLNQKQKQVVREESSQDARDSYHLGPLVDVHPQGQSYRASGNRLADNRGEGQGIGNGRAADQIQKQEKYFPDPLPLVHVKPRSDWADDERDTGHGIVERGRDGGYSNSESYWDRDFDFPRPSLLPNKPTQNQYDRRGQRDNETGKNFSSEVLKVDPHHKDVRAPNREGNEANKFRSSPLSKDRFNPQEVGNYGVDVSARMAGHNNMVNENKYTSHYGDTGRDGSAMPNRDSMFGKRDFGLVGRQQQRNNSTESFNNRGADRNSRDRKFTEQPNRYRGDSFQNNAFSTQSFASGGKLPPVTDPILTMGRDKRFSKGDRSFPEDSYFDSSGFDERDIFSGGLVGVIKRKKDAAKSTDFHDPVRESFEAELERVQKMQELERQKLMEEQERALEHARREEEDRQRRNRDEEERRQRLEEEAREAAWRAEQERLEAIRKAEEQRIAREEEKRRFQMEDDRRMQAAKQKLLDLEARMFKREAEAAKGDSSVSAPILSEKLEESAKEKNTPMNPNLDTWEDEERMVENVTASMSFDSSVQSRPVEKSSRPYSQIEGSSNFLDRGKAINSWRRDAFENGDSFRYPLPDQEIGHYSPRRDAFGGARASYRKDFNAGAGYMSSRAYPRAGVQEPLTDEFGYQKDPRWVLSGEMDSEYHDIAADKYGESGWGQDRTRSNNRPYPEQLYSHSEANDFYSYGRSRYSVRQPRVLPPPSVASAQKTNLRVTERSSPSTFLNSDIHYTHAARTESTRQAAYFDSNQGDLEQSGVVGLQQENSTLEDQKLNNTSRCDSQSSLSVSSPPTSPPHLSQDELDESGDSPVTSAIADGKRSLLTGSGSIALNGNSGNSTIVMPSDSISAVEDEEWTENDDMLQQQEEYDEDEDGYREEEEVREGDDDNLAMNQKFEGLELAEGESDNVVLGFDEGVEVVIPSDDLEKNVGTHERLELSNDSVGIKVERGPFDGFPSDEHSLQPADNSYGTSVSSSTENIPEKSALEGSIDQSIGTSYSSATTDLLDGPSPSGNNGLASISSSGDLSAAATQIYLPSSSSAGSPADLPVKLQFGLFSGPSLIPSPVPAIQIGSIQMPLHIYPPVGPALHHLHPSQPAMFQFGQLRYTSPVSQGILPIAPQSMSFVQPSVPGHSNVNHNTGGSVPHQPARDASTQNVTKDDVQSVAINKQPGIVSAPSEQSNGGLSLRLNSALDADSRVNKSTQLSTSAGVSAANDKKMKSGSGSQGEEKGKHILKAKGSESQVQHVQPTMQSVPYEKNFNAQRGAGPFSGGRGKRFAYAVKNANTRSSFQDHGMPSDSIGFQRKPRRTVQRTEFRVRENGIRKPAPVSSPSDNTSLDDKSNYTGKLNGVFARSGSKRGNISNRSLKQRNEPGSLVPGKVISLEANSGDRAAKEIAKKPSSKSQNILHTDGANSGRNFSEEDIDAPLQSGIVRVFKQPGIEAPSDEDDFIEVRSKRQMLNDRREQKEKEIKAKTCINKPPRRPRSTRQKDIFSRNHHKLSVPLGSEEPINSHLNPTDPERPWSANNEGSSGYGATAPQHPDGAAIANSEVQAINPPKASSVPVVSSSGTECDTGLTFDSKNKVMDQVETSSTTWKTAGINQQVMSLSQTQIDEAIKPARYDSHISAVGGHSSTVSDPILPTSSIMTKDKTFSSGASPINSLLAGEKIQFGAVTSPTVLPPSTRAVSHGIGAPGSNRGDVQMSRNFSASENENSLFFVKEKHLSDSCAPLQDSEAEAEAAASAVAVAAISSDEIVGNSVNDPKDFASAGIDSIATGMVGDQNLASQSRVEELSVSLPADLSVETLPISLWPPLPSPQSSSNQMLSHFPGGPPSHFPFFEMNPLMGGQIFAYSPHEESSGTQSQPQKTATSGSGPLGNWHSGVDSFYGHHPPGYPGQFISPPGGIPGVQGPPHMVVYNHFAPVGQYGQVGLSFMGTTYIPSGKQPDWKKTPSSAPMHISEGDVNNINLTAVQRNAPTMTAPIQHLAPGSPLLPMPSPLPMFDVSPFQTSPDLPVQARWGHIPASQLQPVPVSRPLQPQVVEGALPSQVNHRHTIDQSLTVNRFAESRIPTPSDKGSGFTTTTDTKVAPFPAELGLVDPLRSTTASSGQSSVVQSLSGTANAESCKVDTLEGNNVKHQNSSSIRTSFSQKSASTQQGYNYQRGGMSHRNNSGNEWSHRRMGYHGRNQPNSMDKGYPASKMKQIYVAKQTTTGSTST